MKKSQQSAPTHGWVYTEKDGWKFIPEQKLPDSPLYATYIDIESCAKEALFEMIRRLKKDEAEKYPELEPEELETLLVNATRSSLNSRKVRKETNLKVHEDEL